MKTLKNIVSRTRELEKIESSRLGSIVKIEPGKNQIWVDYQDNPTSKPLVARLGTPWVQIQELNTFLDRVDRVQLDFFEGDPCKPIIRDLFFSVNDINQSNSLEQGNRTIVLDAEEIILRGQKRVIIESGNARTTYNADGSQIIQEAEQIESTAEVSNRVKGGAVLLN